MFGSLTPLILAASGLKSSTGIVFNQASKHAAYSPSLTVALCETIKLFASFALLTRALHQERTGNLSASTLSQTGQGYLPVRADDLEAPDTEVKDKSRFTSNNDGASATHRSPSLLESSLDDHLRVPPTLMQHVLSQIFQMQGLRLIVPALIYVVQNNLYLYAASVLDPAYFQALWQMRILMSALLTCTVLKKRILPLQWLCILGIFGGVMLVKAATSAPRVSQQPSRVDAGATLSASIALCVAALLSSTAGVFLEYIFRDRKVNLWASNVQLSCFSILPAASIFIFGNSSNKAAVYHDLHASLWPTGAILCQSFNGMVIAILLKKAGVLINDLTSAVSIVLTFALNEMLFPASSTIGGVSDVMLVIVGSAVILACSVSYNRLIEALPKPRESRPPSTLDHALRQSIDVAIHSPASPVRSLSASSSASSPVATPPPHQPAGYFRTANLQKDDEKGYESAALIQMSELPFRSSLRSSP
ncbi:Nucleotide-sugar transporter [Kalmanozyma brasiliensis GHG001]|uniref:UDP-galactose transporter n=1 Tax=Kalmanozyma brasiliensis (strain GHG001) TaxID=1365824 RepID=V5EXD0_KALBG|nr:Nucleotide-sugar transporter [Kalmanozyma brasiliensis GHG001]EST08123.1 Nucleotide-sugar transporter [Kalmanozyma brasiliensis GHG001]